MDNIGKPEIATRRLVTDLFCNELGYQYLSDWKDLQKSRDGAMAKAVSEPTIQPANRVVCRSSTLLSL